MGASVICFVTFCRHSPPFCWTPSEKPDDAPGEQQKGKLKHQKKACRTRCSLIQFYEEVAYSNGSGRCKAVTVPSTNPALKSLQARVLSDQTIPINIEQDATK